MLLLTSCLNDSISLEILSAFAIAEINFGNCFNKLLDSAAIKVLSECKAAAYEYFA